MQTKFNFSNKRVTSAYLLNVIRQLMIDLKKKNVETQKMAIQNSYNCKLQFCIHNGNWSKHDCIEFPVYPNV